MQTRWMSFMEAVTNIMVGYGLAVLSQIVVFPLFGLYASLSDNLLMGAAFTTISMARSYALPPEDHLLQVLGVTAEDESLVRRSDGELQEIQFPEHLQDRPGLGFDTAIDRPGLRGFPTDGIDDLSDRGLAVNPSDHGQLLSRELGAPVVAYNFIAIDCASIPKARNVGERVARSEVDLVAALAFAPAGKP